MDVRCEISDKKRWRLRQTESNVVFGDSIKETSFTTVPFRYMIFNIIFSSNCEKSFASVTFYVLFCFHVDEFL